MRAGLVAAGAAAGAHAAAVYEACFVLAAECPRYAAAAAACAPALAVLVAGPLPSGLFVLAAGHLVLAVHLVAAVAAAAAAAAAPAACAVCQGQGGVAEHAAHTG